MDMAFELFRYSYYVRSLLAAPLTNIGIYLDKTDQIKSKKKCSFVSEYQMWIEFFDPRG